jgi:hypothetical protein
VNDPAANSVVILDVGSMTWLAPKKVGKKELRHVYSHGAAIVGNTVMAFGGFDGRQAANDFVTVVVNP